MVLCCNCICCVLLAVTNVSSTPNAVRFCFWCWMKSEVYETKVVTPYEFSSRILDAAAHIKKHEDQLRQTTRDLRTRVAKFTEVDGGIF